MYKQYSFPWCLPQIVSSYRMRVRCLAACPRCSVAMDTVVSNYQKQNGASDKTRRESSRETLSQKGSGTDAESETPPTPSKFTSTGFYGKRPSLPPGTTTSQPPPPPLTTEGNTSHRKLPPDVASPRAVKKATSTYSREDLLGSAKKKSGNGAGDSFTFDLPSPTTPSASLGEMPLNLWILYASVSGQVSRSRIPVRTSVDIYLHLLVWLVCLHLYRIPRLVDVSKSTLVLTGTRVRNSSSNWAV